MQLSVGHYLISMSLYVAILLVTVELMRKYYRFAAVFWLVGLLSFPLWFNQLEGWFRWAKTFSVLVPTALIVGLGRIAQYDKREGWWKLYRRDWVLWSLYGILGLNILEASLKDWVLGNYFNSVSGFILIATIPLFRTRKSWKQGWAISEQAPGDLLVYTDPLWNFLYTTWNLAFVYAENPGYAASSFCILLAAELYPLLKKRPELYVMARVYTLALHILIRSTYDIFTPFMDSSVFASEWVVNYWGGINLALHLPYLFWYFIRRRKQLFPAEVHSNQTI